MGWGPCSTRGTRERWARAQARERAPPGGQSQAAPPSVHSGFNPSPLPKGASIIVLNTSNDPSFKINVVSSYRDARFFDFTLNRKKTSSWFPVFIGLSDLSPPHAGGSAPPPEIRIPLVRRRQQQAGHRDFSRLLRKGSFGAAPGTPCPPLLSLSPAPPFAEMLRRESPWPPPLRSQVQGLAERRS